MSNRPAETTRTDLDPRWSRIVARDASADGSFFYSVSSTGVFCRPSCGSRQANPRHVRLHDTIAACLQAGYRPCLRCRPDLPSPATRRDELVTRVCRLIEEAEEPPSLADLARSVGLSRHHLHRLFTTCLGVTPRAYADGLRAARVSALLGVERSVTQAIHEGGFNTASRFYETAMARLGMTPSRYRSGGAGSTVRFAVGQCTLGAILVACSDRGVCAILLGDDPETLTRDLQDRFGQAELVGADASFETLVAQVVGLADAPRAGPATLPLDIRGTAFQQRVWQALREIPPGETISYASLAARIGLRGGARAVAGACAANPIALAVPCHRVVRTDGSLSGYRWGIERKRTLLERERSSTQS